MSETNNCARAVLAIIAVFAITSCGTAADEPELDSNGLELTGLWTCENYGCWQEGEPRNYLTEIIDITKAGNVLTAVKVTGDACIPAGEVTFRATLPSDTRTLEPPVTLDSEHHVGFPGEAKRYVPGTLEVGKAGSIQFYWFELTDDLPKITCRRSP